MKNKKIIAHTRTATLIDEKFLVNCEYCHHAVHNGNYCEDCGRKLFHSIL